MKKSSTVIPVLLGLTLFTSCVKLDVEVDNYVDTYISCKIINGDTVFAVEGYTQSNYNMKSVSMKNTDSLNMSFDLEQMDYYGGVFEKKTSTSEYSGVLPHSGIYSFSIVYLEESPLVESDFLTDKFIYPSKVTSITPKTTENAITVNWSAVANADFYTVKIINDSILVFASQFLEPTVVTGIITPLSNGWVNQYQPVPGKEYELLITAVLLEKGATQYLESQCISYSERKKTIWPEIETAQ